MHVISNDIQVCEKENDYNGNNFILVCPVAVTFSRDREFIVQDQKIVMDHSQTAQFNSLDRNQDASVFTDIILPDCPSARHLYFVCMSVGVDNGKL